MSKRIDHVYQVFVGNRPSGRLFQKPKWAAAHAARLRKVHGPEQFIVVRKYKLVLDGEVEA